MNETLQPEPRTARLLHAIGALRAAAPADRDAAADEVRAAADAVVATLNEGTVPNGQSVDFLVAAGVLLAHDGSDQLARALLSGCAEATAGTPETARVIMALAAIEARAGDWAEVERVLLGTEPTVPVMAGLAMCTVYGAGDPDYCARVAELGLDAFRAVPTLRFAVAATLFDRAILRDEVEAAGELLGQLESAAIAAADDLGDEHPRLVLILLTLTTAQCLHAAATRDAEKLRRAKDILAVAVQRASALLGPDDVRTQGGLAAVVRAEVDLAILTGSVDDVRRAAADLAHLGTRLSATLGPRHPLTVAAKDNATTARETFGTDPEIADDEPIMQIVDLDARRDRARTRRAAQARWTKLAGVAAATVAVGLFAGLANSRPDVSVGIGPSNRPYPATTEPTTTPIYVTPPGDERALTFLQAQAEHDRVPVELLLERWVPQLSSKTFGLVDNGRTYTYSLIEENYRQVRAQHPGVLLLYSSDFTSFEFRDYWVVVLPRVFADPTEVNAWCSAQGIAPRDCFAKRLSHTGNSQKNTLLRK